MRSPIVFALELVIGMAVAVGGAFLAAKAGGKLNAKSNADIRTSLALNRIAAAMERAVPVKPKTAPQRDPYQWRGADGSVNTITEPMCEAELRAARAKIQDQALDGATLRKFLEIGK